MASNVIAIDGPAASGKSTAARNLAARLGIPYINTGSLYRAIAWKAGQKGISTRDEAALQTMLADTVIRYAVPAGGGNPDIEIDGVFPGQALRAPEIAQGASNVAAIPFVRAFTLQIQRDAAKTQLVVMEGRDIGTAVFPDAKYKFFLTASPRVRALRRLAQGGETPDNATVDSVAAEIAERDRQDMNRSVAPLKQAEDAVFIDSSGMTAEEVLDAMVLCIRDGGDRPGTISASIDYRVPYADTDQMTFVYYANYLIYFEMSREELMRAIGLPYSKLEELGCALPVLEAVCHYKKPARFEDVLTITATLAEMKGVRVKIACTVKRGDELLAEGWTVHAFMNRDGRPQKPPQVFLDAIESAPTNPEP